MTKADKINFTFQPNRRKTRGGKKTNEQVNGKQNDVVGMLNTLLQ
jgi:hypothetical protein